MPENPDEEKNFMQIIQGNRIHSDDVVKLKRYSMISRMKFQSNYSMIDRRVS